MKTLVPTLITTLSVTLFDGDGDGDADGAGGAGGAGGGAAPKTFTKEEVDSLITERMGDLDQQMQEMNQARQDAIAEMEALRASSTATDEQRKAFQEKLTHLQSKLRTTEEKAAFEQEQLKQDSETRIQDLEGRLNSVTGMYHNHLISNDLHQAAHEGHAANINQVMRMLRPDTQAVEEVDDQGNPTGVYRSEVVMKEVGEDGKLTELRLSPKDAVERMRQQKENANLFSDLSAGGIGTSANTTKQDLVKLAKDPAKWIANRDKISLPS